MTAHTQGPWKLCKELTRGEFGINYRIRGPRDCMICTIGPNAQDANGALIAAAPELLAACEAALVTLEDEYPECVQGDYPSFKLLRAAINKAKGA